MSPWSHHFRGPRTEEPGLRSIDHRWRLGADHHCLFEVDTPIRSVPEF